MDYLYDVFISYRRHPEWTPWTREYFYKLLDAYLTQDLTRTPHIFVDDQITPGRSWPQRIGVNLARARVLLAIFSGDYFSSEWCLHELDLMHCRLLRFPHSTLIVPIIGHDGDLIPIEIGRIQHFDLSQFRNTDLQRHTPRFEQFSDAVKLLSPHLAAAIGSAPGFDPIWVDECQKRLDQVYQAHCNGASVQVTTLTLKPLPCPLSPPRVII